MLAKVPPGGRRKRRLPDPDAFIVVSMEPRITPPASPAKPVPGGTAARLAGASRPLHSTTPEAAHRAAKSASAVVVTGGMTTGGGTTGTQLRVVPAGHAAGQGAGPGQTGHGTAIGHTMSGTVTVKQAGLTPGAVVQYWTFAANAGSHDASRKMKAYLMGRSCPKIQVYTLESESRCSRWRFPSYIEGPRRWRR